MSMKLNRVEGGAGRPRSIDFWCKAMLVHEATNTSVLSLTVSTEPDINKATNFE
jgi:hypothetical protein